MTLALCTALRVCWTVDGMWQLGYYLLFRLPPTIPCIACDLLSLSGAEVEQRVQLSHLCLWENFCPRELNGILFFCGACTTFNLCSERSFVSRVSRQKLPVTGASGRGNKRARFQFAHLGALPYFPPIFVSWFLLSLSAVLFLFVSRPEGFCRSVHSVISRPCNIPKVTSNLLAFFFSPVMFSFAFVSTLFCLTRVKKKKRQCLLSFAS